jgi:hypothetical protein
MRNLIIAKITDMLMTSREYGRYLSDYNGYGLMRHNEILASLERANDSILLSLYDRMKAGSDIVPCAVDEDGCHCNVLVSGMYGAILEDGTLHT